MKSVVVLFSLLLLFGCATNLVVEPVFKTRYLHSQPGTITHLPASNPSVFTVSSPSGIGKGSIELLEGEWPSALIIRLHLKGLEGFTLSANDATFDKVVLSVNKPESSGYYDVQLDTSFFPAKTTVIYLSWVDFYR